MSRIAVVAFSGGLDTSCIVSWLKEDWYGFDEVVAVLVDVGQEFDLEASIERGRAAGADDVVLVDRKAAFAEEQCARAIKTNALYEGKYPLVSALSRPVIAQAVAELAVELGAEAVVHGCTGKGRPAPLRALLQGDRSRPARDRPAPTGSGRDEEIEYALAKGIPSGHAGGAVLDRREPLRPGDRGGRARGPGRRRRMSRALTGDPLGAGADEVTIGFGRASRSRSTARSCRSRKLIARLNALAGRYGIGRLDMIENRAVGIKSREVYEAPAAIVPIQAHSALEDVVLTKDEARIKRARAALDRARLRGALVQPGARGDRRVRRQDAGAVDGDVRVELRPNAAVVTGRRSPHMLYAEQLASYGAGETFPHAAAEGFVKIASLEVELAAARRRAKTTA